MPRGGLARAARFSRARRSFRRPGRRACGSAQTRTHDVQNRISTVSGATSPLHSANGEMTRDETGQLLAYDAWGRLVTVNTDGTGGVEITNLHW